MGQAFTNCEDRIDNYGVDAFFDLELESLESAGLWHARIVVVAWR